MAHLVRRKAENSVIWHLFLQRTLCGAPVDATAPEIPATVDVSLTMSVRRQHFKPWIGPRIPLARAASPFRLASSTEMSTSGSGGTPATASNKI